MRLLEVLTPTYIYHGCSTQKKFWEENFTLVNMESFGRRNVRKNRQIKNYEQYITLELSLKLYCLEKSGATSSESRDYM